MKTEDDPSSSDFIASVPPVSAIVSAATSSSSTPSPPADAAASISATSSRSPTRSPKRRKRKSDHVGAKKDPDQKVCDNCRTRRVRCDYQLPCARCVNCNIACTYKHVPQKRGPKTGNGKVLNKIREIQSMNSAANVSPQDLSWDNNAAHPRNAPEPRSPYTSDQYQPLHRPYLQLIPKCVELYYEHIYPIQPFLYMPAIRAMVQRQMTDSEKNLIYALCAMVCLHMSAKSLHVDGPESWEDAGRFFVNECVSTRNKYDFLDDDSLKAVISSFWLSTSFFELKHDRKSWTYLREALTLAVDMGLHDDSTYVGLSPTEILCRQRVFWIFFVTERSFAILRKRPVTFKKTPSLPTTRHAYESPDIHTGLLQVVSSYTLLDESFMSAWDDDNDSRISATNYLALQHRLAQPQSFLQRSRASTPSSGTAAASITGSEEEADEEIVSEPTAIQKADLLITQQWLRLIVWESSRKRRLLSWNSPHESMNYALPLEIARATANMLQSLSSSAVEVHGMGIFEKIFHIGKCAMNVLDQMDQYSAARGSMSGISGAMGMDFVGSGDLGLLSVSRRGITTDPFEVFIRTLSGTPNSRTQFAETLLAVAQQRPGVFKMALTPSLSTPNIQSESLPWTNDLSAVASSLPMSSMRNEVVKDENDMDAEGSNGWSLGNTLSLDEGAPASSLLSDPTFDFNTPAFHAAPSNPPNNQRQASLTTFPMSSLDTSIQPTAHWVNDMGAATQDWSSYGLSSPAMDSATYSNPVSAYSSTAGTPIGNFSPSSLFSRQDSGDNSPYQYQQRPQPPYFGANASGGGSNNGLGRGRTKPVPRFLGSFEWPATTN